MLTVPWYRFECLPLKKDTLLIRIHPIHSQALSPFVICMCGDHGLYVVFSPVKKKKETTMVCVIPLLFCIGIRHLECVFHIYKYRQHYFHIWAIKTDNHKIFGFVNTYQEYDLFF